MSDNGKVALVTGASAGIGKASAIALAKSGWTVVLTGRRKSELEAAAAEATSAGGKGIAIVADVADPASITALFAKTMDMCGRLDFLFNNAGRGAPATSVEELSFELWKAVVDTNLTGSFLCSQAAMKIMKAQKPMGGRIVNNGSISAHAPRPGAVAYTSTKHAITGLTKSISLDGRKYDIACGQIDIGNAATDMTDRMTKGVPQPNGEMMIEDRMNVQHVADAIVYMASLPLDANVQFLTVMATKMPFIGRG